MQVMKDCQLSKAIEEVRKYIDQKKGAIKASDLVYLARLQSLVGAKVYKKENNKSVSVDKEQSVLKESSKESFIENFKNKVKDLEFDGLNISYSKNLFGYYIKSYEFYSPIGAGKEGKFKYLYNPYTMESYVRFKGKGPVKEEFTLQALVKGDEETGKFMDVLNKLTDKRKSVISTIEYFDINYTDDTVNNFLEDAKNIVSEVGKTKSKKPKKAIGNKTAETSEGIEVKEENGDLKPGMKANEGQSTAISKIKEWFSGNQLSFMLTGRGGTGKTTTVEAAIKSLGLSNKEVAFATPTNKATKVLKKANDSSEFKDAKYYTVAQLIGLREAGFDSVTGAAKFVEDPSARKPKLPNGGVLVIDESSMLISDHMSTIENRAKESGTKILYMGDRYQLPPIESVKGKPVKEAKVFDLLKSENESTELTERMRTKKGSPIVGVTDIAIWAIDNNVPKQNYVFNNVYTSLVKEDRSEGVIVSNIPNVVDLAQSFAIDFKRDPKSTRMINFNNANHVNTKELVDAIRQQVLGDIVYEKDSKYVKGEILVLNKPYAQNPDIPEEGRLTTNSEVRVIDGEVRKERITYAQFVKGKGKVYKTTRPVKLYLLAVEDIDSKKEHNLTLLHEDESNFLNELKNQNGGVFQAGILEHIGDVSYAYVINSHKAQGSTYNTVYVDVDNIVNGNPDENSMRKSMYVALSRASKKLVMVGRNKGINRLPGADNSSEVYTKVSMDTYDVNDAVNKC
jgi:hypothetical protein